ncbi:MAG: GHKL domain-containing protein [Ruminococcus sp.]|nr:GHKL domain-containing protein [Ruminococcus sp.]
MLLFSVLTSIVLQFTKEHKGVEFPWVIGTQIVIGFGEVTAVLAVAVASGNEINSKESWFIIIAMVCMVAANISIGMLAPYLLKQVTMSTNMDYGKELSNMEYKYYEMSVENDRKIHAIRHDISNHIQTIYSLFSNGENRLGLELINELKTRYALVEQMVYCNNPVVNIILSNKKSEAEEKNIEFQIRVREDLDNMCITDFDLSTVICNLLDNAICGCVSSEHSHPRLVIEILQKNQYLVVRVLNSCKVGMNIESTDRIETTKSNSQTHGLGMPIIAGIAKKYRGDFIVSAQNGIFTATVVMSVKPTPK